jgi:hypothetical protein
MCVSLKEIYVLTNVFTTFRGTIPAVGERECKARKKCATAEKYGEK